MLDGDSRGVSRDACAEAVLASVRDQGRRSLTQDERESGFRQVLNFGHTLGHAIEAAAEYRLGHGSAVALGMRAEARIGERLGVTEAGHGSAPGGGPRSPPRHRSSAMRHDRRRSALRFLGADKKVRAGRHALRAAHRGSATTDPGDRLDPPRRRTTWCEDALRHVLESG